MYDLLKSLGYYIEDKHKLVGYVKFYSMREAIYDFFDNTKTVADDTLLFYYSGHGRPTSEDNVCFTSSETDYNYAKKESILSSELTNLMHDSVSSKKVGILDCCYSGSAKINNKVDKGKAAAVKGRVALEKSAASLQQQNQ